jgi:hypothetical protein
MGVIESRKQEKRIINRERTRHRKHFDRARARRFRLACGQAFSLRSILTFVGMTTVL